MKARFIMFRRGEVFYAEDISTGKQQSLRTKDESEAQTPLTAKNESFRQPTLNPQIARAYLSASDPAVAQRTWQTVMDQMQTHGKDKTRLRCERAMKAFDALRHTRLSETTADHFLTILKDGKVSVVHFLRRLHNLGLSLGWLAVPVLAPKLWTKPQTKAKRGITLAEHQSIISAEKNPERNLYYHFLWEVGASQSDAAAIMADDIDWRMKVLTYFRKKTGSMAQLAIGSTLLKLLHQLPSSGPLFPKISLTSENDRSAEFRRRCRLLKIEGVSLHSYRYAWAERANTVGMEERFAQAALGHSSRAVHRAYAKKARVIVPPLEDYEKKAASAMVTLPIAAAA